MKKKLWFILTALLVLALASVAYAADAHPGMITITAGHGINVGQTVYPGHSQYPMYCTFELDEYTIPLQNCSLGIYNYDCDETNNIAGTREYDMVFVNDVFVGALTGQDGTWNTSYFNVPVSALRIGENKITIYVGHEVWNTGEKVQHSQHWVVRVDRLTLQFDGGQSDNAPDKFEVSLDYAMETPNGIQCGATASIESDKTHSYEIEYSLVDKCNGSPTYGQIIAADAERLTGSSLVSTGHFNLGYQPPMGTYIIECTLSDPHTGEVYDTDTYEFNLGDALEGGCDHEGKQDDTFSRTIYRMLASGDAQYDTHHQMQDVSWNTCALCGKIYYIYAEWETGAHSLPVCVCGYVEAGYQPIKSAVFEAVNGNNVGSDHVIRVVTDEHVGRVSAVNDVGNPVYTQWVKSENGDGTCTWTCVFQPTVAFNGRYWTVTAYNLNNRSMGKMDTNKLDILEGKQTAEQLDESIQTYSIQVVDADTTAKIAGASVTLCGQTAQTNADGVAVFDYAKLKGKGLFVTKSGSQYDMAQNATFTPDFPGGMEVVTLTQQKYTLSSASVNGENLLTGRRQINNKLSEGIVHIPGDTAAFELQCKISDGAKVLEYAILQQGRVLGSSADGKIKIVNSAFVQNAPVEARVKVKYANGVDGEFTTPLNLGIASFAWSNTSGTLNNVLSAVDAINPAVILANDKDSNSGFGGFISNLFKNTAFKKVYVEPKYTLDNYKRSMGLGLDFADINKRNFDMFKNEKLPASVGFHVVPTLLYVEEYNEVGRQSSSGKLQIELGWRGSGEWQFYPLGIPVVLKVRYEVNGEGEVSDLGMNVQTDELLVPGIYLGINGNVSPSLGIGIGGSVPLKAHAGVRGTLGVKGGWDISFKPADIDGSIEVYGDFGIYAEVGVKPFVVSGYWKLCDGTIWTSGSAVELTRNFTRAQYFADFQKSAHAGVISDTKFASEQPAGLHVTQRENGHETQVVSAGDTTLMVYLADEERNGVTGSALWYQEWKNGIWSEPKRVSETDRFDGEFHVYSDGEVIYLAYTQLNKEIQAADLPQSGEDVTTALDKVYKGLQSIDLHVASYEPGKGFSTLEQLTKDQVFDSYPQVFAAEDQIVVAWVKSSDTATVSNTSEVHAAVLNADGSWMYSTLRAAGNAVGELSLGQLQEQIVVVTNEIVAGTEETNLVAYTLDGQATTLDTGVCGSPVFGNDTLYWNAGGAVKRIEAYGADPVIVLDEVYNVNGKMVLSIGNGYDMLLFGQQDMSDETVETQLYGILLNDENAEPVVLTTLPGSAYTLDCLTLPDGLFLISDVLSVNAAGTPAYSLCSEHLPYAKQLYPLSVSYVPTDIQPGAELNVIASLYNGGVSPIKQVNIHVNNEIVQTIDIVISSGQIVEMPFTLQLPDSMKGALQYGFSTEGDPAEVSMHQLALERTDVRVYVKELILGGKNHLQYSVQNAGTVECSVTMVIYADQKNGNPLKELNFTLSAGHVANDFFPVDDLLKLTTSNTFYVELIAEGDEVPNDNAATIGFTPIGE